MFVIYPFDYLCAAGDQSQQSQKKFTSIAFDQQSTGIHKSNRFKTRSIGRLLCASLMVTVNCDELIERTHRTIQNNLHYPFGKILYKFLRENSQQQTRLRLALAQVCLIEWIEHLQRRWISY